MFFKLLVADRALEKRVILVWSRARVPTDVWLGLLVVAPHLDGVYQDMWWGLETGDRYLLTGYNCLSKPKITPSLVSRNQPILPGDWRTGGLNLDVFWSSQVRVYSDSEKKWRCTVLKIVHWDSTTSHFQRAWLLSWGWLPWGHVCTVPPFWLQKWPPWLTSCHWLWALLGWYSPIAEELMVMIGATGATWSGNGGPGHLADHRGDTCSDSNDDLNRER